MISSIKLDVSYKTADGGRAYVNPLHIVQVIQTPDCKFLVQLTNGEKFEVSYTDANKIREFFNNI